MNDAFEGLFNEVNQDYAYALDHPQTDADGIRHWRDVVYAHVQGFRPLMLYVSAPPVKSPALLCFIHGGAWRLGHPEVTSPIYRRLDFIGKFLRAGFAVAKISYRLSAEARFPTQLHDCKAAIRFLRNHAQAFGFDPNRVAAFGDSAGGHLAALVGLTGNRSDLEGEVGERGSSAVQAVVDWFGPTDLLTMSGQAIPGGMHAQDAADSPESELVGGPIQQNKEAARAASPLAYVGPGAPPFHIQHGALDRLVPIRQSETFHAALIKAGVNSTLVRIEGADHCFWGAPLDGIVERDIAFLKARLGGQPS
jgi:acetyl esterase/lipase